MDAIHKKLNDLKEDIFNTNLSPITNDDSSTNKLVGIKNLDGELREALILLTSNYKSELQAIRHHQVMSLISIIDADIALLNKYKGVLVEVDNLKARTKKPVLTFKNIIRSIGILLGTTTFMTLLYHFEPVAVDKAISAVSSLLHLSLDVIKKVL